MNIPKGISNHPAVKEAIDADSVGYDFYKYNIILKDGWVFEYGRNAGCQEYNCNTVAEFKYANPVRKSI